MAATGLYVAAFAIVIFFIYWKSIYDLLYNRWRLIKTLHPLPGPFSLPIIGTVWQFKWNMTGMFISEK